MPQFIRNEKIADGIVYTLYYRNFAKLFSAKVFVILINTNTLLWIIPILKGTTTVFDFDTKI